MNPRCGVKGALLAAWAVLLAVGCAGGHVSRVPVRWTEELAGQDVAHIRGAPDGAGPYVAGRDLWERTDAGWRQVAVEGGPWRTVWPRTATDVWSTGEHGSSAHLGPDGWRAERFPEGTTGISVIGWEGGEAWSPVTLGEIYRHDGTAWRSWKPAALADRSTGALWGAAPDDVWVHTHRATTGVPPDLGHWDGHTWTFHTLWKNGYIANMAGSASDDVWAVGWVVYLVGKGALVAHWDGRSWSRVDVPVDRRLCDVYVAPDGEVWLAGFQGTLLRGRAGSFEALEAPDHIIESVYARDRRVWIVVGDRVLSAEL